MYIQTSFKHLLIFFLPRKDYLFFFMSHIHCHQTIHLGGKCHNIGMALQLYVHCMHIYYTHALCTSIYIYLICYMCTQPCQDRNQLILKRNHCMYRIGGHSLIGSNTYSFYVHRDPYQLWLSILNPNKCMIGLATHLMCLFIFTYEVYIIDNT